jgi:hypothetical protein
MWPHSPRPHCSTADAPTRDLLNSQHLTNDELCALVDYCYKTGTTEGLQVAAMVLLGIYAWGPQVRCASAAHCSAAPQCVALGAHGTAATRYVKAGLGLHQPAGE